MIPQYRIEQYLNAINAAYLGDSPLPEYPSEPVWRIEVFLAAILSAAKGDSPVMACPDPVWHIEEFARAIYDALVGASPAWPCPTATNNIEAILHAIYKVVADGTETDGIATSWDIERWLLDSYDAAKEGGGGTETTVTGTLPLTLANALSHAIVSLTRYGLCTQDGTPTPADPVPIKCNNGTLTTVDDELPTGYKRLIGITFDGNIRYETGEYLTGDDDVTMTLNNISSSGKNLFGSYNGANDKNFSMYIYGSSTSGSYFRYGDQLKRPKYGGTGKRTITFGKSGTSGFADDSDVTPDEFTTPANACIGMLPNSSSAAFMGDIVGSILVSNRLEWIPCERESDGVIGYYEKHNGNFIAPTGNGTPVSLGYDTSHLVLRVVGTPEVLTVGGTNLLNVATNTTGKYISASGDIAGGDGQYTDLIPVTVGNLYVCAFTSARGSGTNRLHGYNSNGTWAKQLSYALATGMQGKKVALSALIPSGISYIRLSYGQTDTDAIISQEPIPSNEFYVGRTDSGTKAYINSLESTITSPYSASAYRGFGIVTPVVPESAYAFTWSGTGLNKYGIGFYASIDDVTDVSKCISGGSIKELSTFVVPSGANYAVLVFANSSPKTLTLDYLYVNPAPTYAPYVASQTASVPMLLSVGDAKDEVELIHGTITRRVTACLYDGTQPVGDVYMSTTGGKDAGAIIVYPLATPTTEQTTAQPLNTNEGTNVVDSVANVGPLTAEVTYKANT